MTDAPKHLWEEEHPYYCQEGNFYTAGHHASYASWAEFMAERGESDEDLNLVYRWDWTFTTGDDGEVIMSADPYYRDGILLVFWMGQRKAICTSSGVSVCKADEPAVREWLAKRFAYLLKLWAPFSGVTP